MTYDFDALTDRSGTYSLKWEEAGDALPMCSIVPDEWTDAYIGWWRDRHGVTFERESLIFCTGVIPAISSMVRKLTTPAENVVIQTPVYNIFFNSILNNGRNVLEAPLAYDAAAGRYAIDWEDLERKLADPQTTLMILCNPHNPSGQIWDRDTLARLGELCTATPWHVSASCAGSIM